MTAVTRPRGPLPARVYWTRRLLVLAVALVLVFGIAHLLGGGSGSGSGPSAQPVGAEQSSDAASVTPSPSPSVSPSRSLTDVPTGQPSGRLGAPPSDQAGGRPGAGATTAPSSTGPGASPSATPSTPLVQPTGSCASSDVVAVPSVAGPAYGAKPVVLTLTLTTRTSPACTWEVSASSLVLKITSGPDRIWSTQDCTAAVHKQVVVVRKDAPTTVSVVWNGQRSDADCSRATPWAEPGYYHAVAAAFGSDPSDVQFRLAPPPRETETASPTPSPTPSGKPSATPSGRSSATPSAHPSSRPTAGRHPSPSATSQSRPGHRSGHRSASPSRTSHPNPSTGPSASPSGTRSTHS